MVQVKDLTELSLRDLWEEVKDEDDWWGRYEATDVAWGEAVA